MMCGARVPTARLALDVSHAPKPETLARGLGARVLNAGRPEKLSRLVALRTRYPSLNEPKFRWINPWYTSSLGGPRLYRR